MLSDAKRLKIISKYGVGLDNINLESLKKRNITLGWTGGVNQRSVSELTLCFMLGLFRNAFQTAFKLKNTRNLDRKSLNLLRKREISSTIH
mgnify:CR=1 FL=1